MDNCQIVDDNILIDTSASDPIKGILEETIVTNIFFSEQNYEALQRTIKYEVYRQYNNTIIGKQSNEQLFIIMRSMLLQYGDLLNPNHIEEVKKINKYVVDFSVKRIISELIQYNGYVNKIDNTPIPLDLPNYTNKNNFTYNLSPF